MALSACRQLQTARLGTLRQVMCSNCWWMYHSHRLPRKLYTTEEEGSSEEAETFEGSIPRDKLTVNFSRSSGPGGQNVNKVNTKAELRFHVDSADWLPQRVKTRLKTLFKTRLNKQGMLMVSSQKTRSQLANVDDAVGKLEGMVSEASALPTSPSPATLTRIRMLKRRAERQRMVEKKYHSRKKADRRTDT